MIEPIVMFTATAMMLAGLGLASAMVWYVQDRRCELALMVPARIAVRVDPIRELRAV